MNHLTILVLILSTAALIAYDIFILIRKGVQATISVTLYKGAQKYPILAFAVGVLIGHLFWAQ